MEYIDDLVIPMQNNVPFSSNSTKCQTMQKFPNFICTKCRYDDLDCVDFIGLIAAGFVGDCYPL